MIGRILSNRYKLIGELGSGGMAWVYLAQDLVEDKPVAVKILYPQHSKDVAFVQRFLREARLSMELSQSAEHPSIVCVQDYGADRDTHYLVMCYVPGQDLGKILDERGTLPWQTALGLARQVATALEHAHQHGIVHRDIKPSNIMVQPDGSVRLLDLGIARARSAPELTLSGFVGTPQYAAPEQMTKGPLNIRADIYALGIVLYLMLSGELPFKGDTPLEVMSQKIAAQPPSLAEQCPGLPPAVVSLVDKAMAKRPRDRFQTPTELVQAIDTVLAGQEPAFTLDSQGEAASDLEEHYQAGLEAMESEHWQEALDYLSRVAKVDPDYRDVQAHLGQIGRQIRLAGLYRSAQRSLEHGQWHQALAYLQKIEELAPGYKNVGEMLGTARDGERSPSTATAGTAGYDALTSATGRLRSRRPSRPVRRTWTWGAAAILVAGGLLAVLLLSGRGAGPPPTPAPSPAASATAMQSQAQASEVLPAGATSSPSPASLPTRTPPPPTHTPEPPSSTATATPAPYLAGQIAFPRFDAARGTYDIHVCAANGSNCRLMVEEASQPDFLPGGAQLVYHSWKPGDQGLILQTLDGQRVWRISDDAAAARPAVDFQGNLYVYHSRQDADRLPRLYRTHNAGTTPLRSGGSDVLGRSPAWTHDGQVLYSGCLGDTCGVLVAQADGSQPRLLVADSSALAVEGSPDGRQVAFMSGRDGNWEIYVVDLSGGPVRRLTVEPGNDGLPAWSPGGRYLAFVSDRDGSWAVWAMRPDGRGQRRLFAVDGTIDGLVRTAAAHEAQGWVEERISWAPEP